MQERPFIEHRQLTAVDREGRAFAFSGGGMLGVHGASVGENSAAAGNLLASAGVPAAMTAAFSKAPCEALGDRLLAALEAGRAARPGRSIQPRCSS